MGWWQSFFRAHANRAPSPRPISAFAVAVSLKTLRSLDGLDTGDVFRIAGIPSYHPGRRRPPSERARAGRSERQNHRMHNGGGGGLLTKWVVSI